MPHHCIVPCCTNRSGKSRQPGSKVSFYQLPLKNPKLLKQWLIKIRRENTPLTIHSRVCSVHFKGGKKTAQNNVPELFEWTKKPYRQAPKNRDKSITENSKVSDDTILASNTGCIYTDCSVQTEDTNVTVADGTTQTVTYTTSDVSIQHSPDLEDHFTQTYVSVNHIGTMTEIDVMDSSPFRIQQIKDDNEAIKFYTRFISFSYFMACFNF